MSAKKPALLIKLGGAALQNPALITSLSRDLSALVGNGIRPVIVHGGGPSINEELTARGISWEFIDGQRVTTPAMIDVIEMVLCGKVNRRIVRELNIAGLPAVGLSGTDVRMLQCRKASEKLGQVGSVEYVDTRAILAVWEAGLIPVIAPLGCDAIGSQAFNVNADWAACRIAEALSVERLLFFTDQDGILGRDGKLIPQIDRSGLESLISEQVVRGGMLAKTQTVVHAPNHGIGKVSIMSASAPHALLKYETGTHCYA
ncbi:MAG: acetylglutamate kinase [Oligoflexia bacterium]|nr:acetylglutamate kinase [Oligoflexia bacterium]